MLNKHEIFETLSKIALIVFLFILIMLISLGIELDFRKLYQLSFWITVGTQLAYVMIVFNMVASAHIRTKSRNKDGRFFIAYATNRLRIKEIEDNKRYDDLSEAVNKENEELYKQKCNDKIHAITSRFGYNEIVENINDLDNLCEKYRITGRNAKRLKKVACKVISGSYHFTRIKDKMFLKDKELCTNNKSMIAFNVAQDKLKGNSARIITFLIITILFNVMGYTYNSVDFWSWLMTNLIILISAIVTGFYEGYREISLRTAMYEERNSFLKKYLNLDVVYENE